MEGRVRRRRPARAGRHRGRGPDLRQLPDLLALPREGLSLDDVTALHRATYDAIAAAYDDEARLPPDMPDVLADPFDRLCHLVPAGGVVADVGCGPGRDLTRLASRGLRPVGVDLSLGMLHRAAGRQPGGVVAGDLRALPLRDDSCAGVWSSYALLHLDDAGLAAALREVRRVLTPGGVAAIVLAAGAGGRERVRYAPDHERMFFVRDQARVVDLCRDAGLLVLQADTVVEGWRSPVRVLARRPLPSPP